MIYFITYIYIFRSLHGYKIPSHISKWKSCEFPYVYTCVLYSPIHIYNEKLTITNIWRSLCLIRCLFCGCNLRLYINAGWLRVSESCLSSCSDLFALCMCGLFPYISHIYVCIYVYVLMVLFVYWSCVFIGFVCICECISSMCSYEYWSCVLKFVNCVCMYAYMCLYWSCISLYYVLVPCVLARALTCSFKSIHIWGNWS
jgi:hypothetical protein